MNELEKNLEEYLNNNLSEMILVKFYAEHIKNPCRTKYGDIRYFWINEAKNLIKTRDFTNPFAKQYLENIINIYS